MHQITCPQGHRIQVSERHLGQLVKCPACQSSFVAGESNGTASAVASHPNPDAASHASAPGRFSFAGLVNSFVGKPMVFFGLILAILGRGCDATGMRSISRTDAQYRQARVALQLEWDSKISAQQVAIDKKNRQIIDLMDSKSDGKDDSQKKMSELQKEKTTLEKDLNKMRQDYLTAQTERENGEWKPLHEASLKAVNDNRMWSYWYEMLFIFGTILLVPGLLIMAFTGAGAERWISYIMIGIITFSIYVGGAAWIESIVTSSGSGPTVPIERPKGGPPF